MTTGNSNLDLVFAMDCTGSMGSYIKSATENIRIIVDEIVAKERIAIRFALVEYRDHPPQDATFVTRVHSFTNTVTEMKGWLEKCSAEGGGDGPEAVADALFDALNLPWRSDAAKICILICDAPPHGLVPAGDSFPGGCPAGHDPLDIARKMAGKNITLYTAGVEPPIVPYRDFFMTLAHITGGQYVPMVDANRLAQMIIAGVREEISIDRLMHSAKPDIAREMRKADSDGIDEQETAARLQRVFAQKKVVVNRMKNAAGTPSKAAEECYSKCVDMSDIQKQFKQTDTISSTKSSEMDYSLEEEKTVSLEQAKRIVQKAKNWDYSSIEQVDNSDKTPCKYAAQCRDHSTNHRSKYSHPQNSNLPTQRNLETKFSHQTTRNRGEHTSSVSDSHRIACKYEGNCHDHREYHRSKYSHPDGNNLSTQRKFETKLSHLTTRDPGEHTSSVSDSHRIACKYEENCRDQSEYHRTKFSHPHNESSTTPCRNGSKCHDRSESHRGKYSHSQNDHSRTQCRHDSKCYDYSDDHRTRYAHSDTSS